MSKTEITAEQLDAAMRFLETTKNGADVIGTFTWFHFCARVGVPLDIRWDFFEALEEAGRLESFIEPESYGQAQYRIVRACQ